MGEERFLLKTCVIMWSSSQIVTFWVGASSTIQINLFQDLEGTLEISWNHQTTFPRHLGRLIGQLQKRYCWEAWLIYIYIYIVLAVEISYFRQLGPKPIVEYRGLVAFPNHHLRQYTKSWLLLILYEQGSSLNSGTKHQRFAQQDDNPKKSTWSLLQRANRSLQRVNSCTFAYWWLIMINNN